MEDLEAEGTQEINVELFTESGSEITPEVKVSEPVIDPAEKEADVALAMEKDPANEKSAIEIYKPNIKFKVLEKEMEIPKEFQSLMKDKESEGKVRELFEKAEGLPIVKQKLENTRIENANLGREIANFKGTITNLQQIYSKAMQSGNLHKLDDWFKSFDIPQDIIIKYAIEKVKLAELPPEQRQMLVGQLDAERNAETQARNAQEFEQKYARQAQELKTLAFESQMNVPETKQLADLYDSRVGKSGAFKDEVRRFGQIEWFTNKIDLSPEQAITKVIENYGLKAIAQTAGSPVAAATVSGTQAPVIKKTVGTIPNISGNSKSPVKSSKPRSMEDLKKLRDEAWA